MISELEEHLKSSCISDHVNGIEFVIEYLKALNSLFELSLLGKQVRIFQTNGSTLQRMEKGFNFFKNWCEDAIEKGKNLYAYIHVSLLFYTVCIL